MEDTQIITLMYITVVIVMFFLLRYLMPFNLPRVGVIVLAADALVDLGLVLTALYILELVPNPATAISLGIISAAVGPLWRQQFKK